jgi:hypothetical protein
MLCVQRWHFVEQRAHFLRLEQPWKEHIAVALELRDLVMVELHRSSSFS